MSGGGGGGNTTTTTAAIDPDIKKRVLPVLGDVTRQYKAETSGQVPTLAGQQGVTAALDQQGQYAQDVFNRGIGQQVDQDLRNLQGQQLAGGQGTLNSARADRARQAGLADRSLQLRQADIDTRSQAAQGQVATQEAKRGLQQQILDQPHTSAQRYFGYLGSAPQSQTTTASGGGGGK